MKKQIVNELWNEIRTSAGSSPYALRLGEALKLAAKTQRTANTVARQNDCGAVDEIVLADKPCIVEHVRCGYRKRSTDQYVPNSYVRKAWRSVYYQHARTVVGLPMLAD